ncbi:monovalent cation/H(+) antiporter subunit G [Desulfofustis glycolicus]|uniref:Multisubunit sodium/proton antiporter, MrpG subunit n=1 Tax=Desulfofustis glycolicus DSM 9705 TaxID=1121409 RepID=A0A1M5XS55_9BACT|nr:monovalent cation/H(+) antiporter subunit G [Desulfofustis glycolicus]MCB2217821.1 monovalent cation/H(+) antiporter subunit G [Desulfobulbaceae bacterium]SHI02586.1 multisubunit sodium/proton antiporter, MrpG subunit [Desulfofustis glycolicus DSM 9705]
MTEILTSLLLLLGSFLCLMAALGIVRLPDALTRMHAATKAGTLGVGLLVVAEVVCYHDLGISLRAATIIFLLLLTTPVAAHLIGRASYLSGVQLSSRTWIDELGASLENENRAETAGENEKQPKADQTQ